VRSPRHYRTAASPSCSAPQGAPWAQPGPDGRLAAPRLPAYRGGQPETVRVDFPAGAAGAAPARLAEPARVLATARLVGAARHDRQATLAVSVGRTDEGGFEAHVQRVDQAWPVEALWIDYLAWTPSLALAADRLRPADRPQSGTGAPGAADPLAQAPGGVLPGPAEPPCARCVHRTAAAVLEPYVLPRAQARGPRARTRPGRGRAGRGEGRGGPGAGLPTLPRAHRAPLRARGRGWDGAACARAGLCWG
jgi:hypothetical protein